MTREEYLQKRREYYQRNKEKWAEYRRTHREEINRYWRERRKKDPETLRERAKRYRRKNPQKIREYSKKYHSSEKGQRQYREYYKTHKEDFFERAKKSRRAHPAEKKARAVVAKALLDGRLHKEPCEVCGEKKVDAHHDDYNKPLDIRWLCRKCHGEWHAHNTPIRALEEKECALCQKTFHFTHRAQKFCSDACRKEWNKTKKHQYYLDNIEKWQ